MSALIPAWLDGDLVALDKLEVHQRGLRHPAVSVFVMCGRQVLIQQRAAAKYHTPGLWANTCCTHPYWGEKPVACALRRLREELGISGLTLSHAGQIEYRADVGNGLTEHEVVEVFLTVAPSSLTVTPHPDEVQATRWVDLHDLAAETERHPARFTPWLRIYLAKHLDQIFGPLVSVTAQAR